jgi:putative DNA primase/helicase
VTFPFGSKADQWPEEVGAWSVPLRVAIKTARTAAVKFENLRGMEPAFTIAQTFLELPDDVWDRDPNLLAVPNGVVDLRTGELHVSRPDYRITRLAGVEYDPDAQCPTFDSFLSQVQPDPEMRLFIQTLIGYGATGFAREQKFYCFTGEGQNGKGTTIRVSMKALGRYAAKANIGMLAEQAPDRPRNDLARLAGVRFVSISETSRHFNLDEANLKTITGGDLLSARFLNQEFFEFLPVFTPVLDTNHALRLHETGVAMRRRVRIVPWGVTIPENQRDETLTDRLLPELPGILAWIVRGAMRYLDCGLREPQRVINASKALIASCDPVGRWLDECTISEQQARTKSSDMYQSYCRWASAEGETSHLATSKFSEALEAKGWTKKKTGGVMVWIGIRLRDYRDDDAAGLMSSSLSSVADSSSTLTHSAMGAGRQDSTFTITSHGSYIA